MADTNSEESKALWCVTSAIGKWSGKMWEEGLTAFEILSNGSIIFGEKEWEVNSDKQNTGMVSLADCAGLQFSYSADKD